MKIEMPDGKSIDIVITDHARDRMRGRKISETDIADALLDPDATMPGKPDGRIRIHKTLTDGRRLQVIYKRKKGRYVIITACWREE